MIVPKEFGEERALNAMGIMSLGTIIDLDRHIEVHATCLMVTHSSGNIRNSIFPGDHCNYSLDDYSKKGVQ